MCINKLAKLVIIVIIFSSVAFYAGWRTGGRFQFNPSYLYYSASQLPNIVLELKLIREHKIKTLLAMKDADLDEALFCYKSYMENLQKNNAEPLLIENIGMPGIKQGLKWAYQYRKNYPRANYPGNFKNKDTKTFQNEIDQFLAKQYK